jgi:hypothetical protein
MNSQTNIQICVRTIKQKKNFISVLIFSQMSFGKLLKKEKSKLLKKEKR